MNRTVKEATVRAFHYETLDSLKAHLDAFITAYSFAKHLKSLRWRTPFQAICDARTKDPTPFIINPHHVISGTTHLGAPINPSGWLVWSIAEGRREMPARPLCADNSHWCWR
jgi:hypothetical protein